jgi:hypothetical protein
MTPAQLELFHELTDPDSAAARRAIVARGLVERIKFRNVHNDEARAAFREHGGERLPAIWDGAQLVQGLDAVLAALTAIT